MRRVHDVDEWRVGTLAVVVVVFARKFVVGRPGTKNGAVSGPRRAADAIVS